eukprot:1324836-Amphidinium_carterae.1
MIKHYYSEQQRNNPELPPYKQRFITFMISKHYESMKTLMKKAESTQQDIKRAYDSFIEGPPGHQQILRQGEDEEYYEENEDVPQIPTMIEFNEICTKPVQQQPLQSDVRTMS